MKLFLLKKNIYYLALIIFFLFVYNFFLNIYIVVKNNYESRMIKYGGYCDFQGYGFVRSIYKNYQLNENFTITNFRDYPSSAGYFYRINNNNNSNYEILINISDENFIKLYKKNKFTVLEKKENCYFIKKNG